MKFVGLCLAAMLFAGAAHSACVENRIELRGDWGNARFRIEVADEVQERATGLMYREEMAAAAGMLFIYGRPQRVSFWMENTLIPLDMIFADAAGTVTHIHENAVPLDRTSIPGGDNVQFVLEINGGMAAILGMTIGSQMRHPGIVQDAAVWPCE